MQGYHQGSYGFMTHRASKEAMTLATDFVLHDGSIPYSYTITQVSASEA